MERYIFLNSLSLGGMKIPPFEKIVLWRLCLWVTALAMLRAYVHYLCLDHSPDFYRFRPELTTPYFLGQISSHLFYVFGGAYAFYFLTRERMIRASLYHRIVLIFASSILIQICLTVLTYGLLKLDLLTWPFITHKLILLIVLVRSLKLLYPDFSIYRLIILTSASYLVWLLLQVWFWGIVL